MAHYQIVKTPTPWSLSVGYFCNLPMALVSYHISWPAAFLGDVRIVQSWAEHPFPTAGKREMAEQIIWVIRVGPKNNRVNINFEMSLTRWHQGVGINAKPWSGCLQIFQLVYCGIRLSVCYSKARWVGVRQVKRVDRDVNHMTPEAQSSTLLRGEAKNQGTKVLLLRYWLTKALKYWY